jgi:HSP20 family protein
MSKWLIPIDPFKGLDQIEREIDSIFTNRPSHKGLRPIFSNCYPAIDIFDKKDAIVVKAEMPGVDKKDVAISITENEMTIKGEVKREQEVNEKDYYHSERSYGTFSRTIGLPSSIDKLKVKAAYKDGILEITLPKSEEAKPKEIKLEIE